MSNPDQFDNDLEFRGLEQTYGNADGGVEQPLNDNAYINYNAPQNNAHQNTYQQNIYQQNNAAQNTYQQNIYQHNNTPQNPYQQNAYQQPPYQQNNFQQNGYPQNGYQQNYYQQGGYPQNGYQQGGFPPYGYPQNGYGGTMNYPPQIRTVNNTAGFVLAIVSIFTVFIPVVGLGLSIAGFALSVKSKREASKNNNIQGGLVIPGLICSIFSLAIHILLIVFVIINGVAGYMLSQSYDDFNDYSGYYDYYDDYNWDNYGDNGDSA